MTEQEPTIQSASIEPNDLVDKIEEAIIIHGDKKAPTPTSSHTVSLIAGSRGLAGGGYGLPLPAIHKNGRRRDRERVQLKPAPTHKPHCGRNDPCVCGSGKKYKKCHGQ